MLGELERGPWIQTYTGRRFYPLDPRIEDVHLQDIAHALSNICRFNGHCARFYSVAEHSVALAAYVWRGTESRDLTLATLLHDAAEAYLSDIPRPLKWHFRQYQARELDVLSVIYHAAGLEQPHFYDDTIKPIDRRILVDEARELMRLDMEDWTLPDEPLGVQIHGWSPETARSEFLHWLTTLRARNGV